MGKQAYQTTSHAHPLTLFAFRCGYLALATAASSFGRLEKVPSAEEVHPNQDAPDLASAAASMRLVKHWRCSAVQGILASRLSCSWPPSTVVSRVAATPIRPSRQ